MSNLEFSLNATMPVFFVIFVGWFLKKVGIIRKDFQDANNRLVFRVLLPVMLFCDVAETDLSATFSMKFFLFCVSATLACFATVWILAALFYKDRASIGSFVQGAIRGSAGILGVAFAENMYGRAGMVPLMMIAIVPIYNIGSVILLTMYSSERPPQGQIKKVCLEVLTNPLILGILAGIPFALLHVQFPALVQKSLNNLSVITSPLALLMVGADFDLQKASAQRIPVLLATAIKLLIQPAIFLPIAVLLGFRDESLIAILIMLGAPATVSGYIMARGMHNNVSMAGSIVVLTTMLSAITVTGIIFVLRTFGYV